MSTSSHPAIPLWIQNRIIGFFNNARNINMVLDGSIQDDPSDGKGSTLGPTLAARILREKSKLPKRRFTDFQQIDSIRGVGEGTIKDLVYSFGITADEVFKKAMYETGTIYKENWPLTYFRFPIEDKEEFSSIVSDKENLREFILQKVENECNNSEITEENKLKMINDLKVAYIDKYSNSTQAAALAFALWFYEFDADNWFSWERIQEQTQKYFDHNANTYPWFMDFYFFKGFVNRGIVQPGICPEDLPVNVNWAEQSITFWISALYD